MANVSQTEKQKVAAAKKKAAQEEKERRAEEKKEALKTYQTHLGEVMKLKAMTDTEAWQAHFRQMKGEITTHGEAVLSAEKPRDVIHHQEGVKVLRALIGKLKKPIADLDHYVRSMVAMPLIAATEDMPFRAEWNDALGKVELKKIGQ